MATGWPRMAACSQASKQAGTGLEALPPSSMPPHHLALEGKGACGTGKTTTLVVDGLVRLGSQCLSACRRHYCRRASGAVVAQYSLASK